MTLLYLWVRVSLGKLSVPDDAAPNGHAARHGWEELHFVLTTHRIPGAEGAHIGKAPYIRRRASLS